MGDQSKRHIYLRSLDNRHQTSWPCVTFIVIYTTVQLQHVQERINIRSPKGRVNIAFWAKIVAFSMAKVKELFYYTYTILIPTAHVWHFVNIKHLLYTYFQWCHQTSLYNVIFFNMAAVSANIGDVQNSHSYNKDIGAIFYKIFWGFVSWYDLNESSLSWTDISNVQSVLWGWHTR